MWSVFKTYLLNRRTHQWVIESDLQPAISLSWSAVTPVPHTAHQAYHAPVPRAVTATRGDELTVQRLTQHRS